MDDLRLLVEMHRNNRRQGPGSEETTLRALQMAGVERSRDLKVADIGCGTGASVLILARELEGSVTAVDLFPEFLQSLEVAAGEQGLQGVVNTHQGSMDSLPFADEELDLIWSEGAIYNMGFAKGVESWSRFLRQGGVLAVSEITWLTHSRPREIEEYWMGQYPEVAPASAKLRQLEEANYQVLGYFPLAPLCWEQEYYAPIERRFESFLEEQGSSAAAQEVVQAEKEEIELYRRYQAYFSYGFYIARKL